MERMQEEVRYISKILLEVGFKLEKEQPHISGERYLLSPRKLVLVGRKIDGNLRVIIKMSCLPKGKKEILEEKRARNTLTSFIFSKETILFPREILFGEHKGYLILITEFIHQEKVFVAHPLEKQFSLILKVFESREIFNTTAVGHIQGVLKTFPIFDAATYLTNFTNFYKSTIRHYHNPEIDQTMKEASWVLKNNKAVIEKYCKHLIHTDFVPHNFRIRDNCLYILDCSAFQFGNKYEEWARLANYMIIHNPDLEKLLKEYVLKKKDEREYLDFRLMRMYKIGFLLEFYSRSLSKTSGNLRVLINCRLELWQEVLRCILEDCALNEKISKAHLKNLDKLRTEAEKNRQREFALA